MPLDLPIKIRKSAGVPVTPAVHRLIRAADAARGSGEWSSAAEGYRKVLDRDPGLAHIWVQLGHTLKEARRYADARAAYEQASALLPGSDEPQLHLGHLAKVAGDPAEAGRRYLAAFQAGNRSESLNELHHILGRTDPRERDALLELLEGGLELDARSDRGEAVAAVRRSIDRVSREIGAASGDTATQERLREASALLRDVEQTVERGADQRGTDGASRAALVFDVSDLISYFDAARLPTGIQRVQIETITHALDAGRGEVRICCFIRGRSDWLEVPPAQFRALARLAVARGDREDPEWVKAVGRLKILLTLAEPFEFPRGANLVNLGTSWWLQNYFLFVREAKRRWGIRYIPFVHDMIPVMTPEHCVRELTQDFISWAIGVFAHADHFLANSESTKRDLIEVAATLGRTVAADSVSVIRLDGDFRNPAAERIAPDALARWGIGSDPFVLFVSTIESRKFHIGALDAWQQLIRRHGARRVPRLVCVGNRGWLNDAVYQRLEQNEALASRVTMLSHLSDDELRLLYRRCRFTLYPSLYEGWGLPVTESLCYGKVPVLSDSSSLPEAAGAFGVYFRSGSANDLAEAVEKVAFDTSYREHLEAKIAAEFAPRPWSAIASVIEEQVSQCTGSKPGQPVVAPALPGRFYPIRRNMERRIWPGLGSGEIFRSGVGWRWPEAWGNWTDPRGGELSIALPADRPAMRLYAELVGPPAITARYRLRARGGSSTTGLLHPDERKWVALDLPVAKDSPVLQLRLTCDKSAEALLNGMVENVGVGITGFVLFELDDAEARNGFLEAVVLGNVDRIDAYREPEDNEPFDDWEDELEGDEEGRGPKPA